MSRALLWRTHGDSAALASWLLRCSVRRTHSAELMDAADLDEAEHRLALAGLRRINTVSAIDRQLWSRLATEAVGRGPLTMVDVGSGLGDVPLAIAQRAMRFGAKLSVIAIDLSPRAAELARERAVRAGVEWTPVIHDVTRGPLPLADHSVDVAMCTLLLHHLTEGDATAVLGELGRVARRRVLVSDLRRGRLGLFAAHVAGCTITRSRVVRVDAVRSVHNAFTMGEMATMAASAGFERYVVKPMWPFRMILDAVPSR